MDLNIGAGRRLAGNPALLFAAALALGGVSFWSAHVLIDSRIARERARLEELGREERIVVASRDLPASSVVTRDMLAARRVPSRFVPSTAVEPARLGEIVGKTLSHALHAGDPLALELLLDEQDMFSAGVREGSRALTLPVDEISSFSGLLGPGDRIDLLYAAAAPDERDGVLAVRPLLQAVPVLATGRATRRVMLRDPNGAAHEEDRQFATITLDVSPQDAQRIVLAQRTGDLTAVLRNPGDRATGIEASVTSAALFSAKPSAPLPPAAVEAHVELLIGGSGGIVRTVLRP
jgi:pilus assembly protein CpaB